MADFKFGEMICYRIGPLETHDGAIMYLGKCHHPEQLAGDIELLALPEGTIDHKDPHMWQRCTHLGGARLIVDGKDISDEVVFVGLDVGVGASATVHGIRDASGTFTITDVEIRT